MLNMHIMSRNPISYPSLEALLAPRIWFPSPINELKLIVDATVTMSDWFGSGFVIRDHMGFPIRAGKRWEIGSPSVLEAEAKHLRWGLQQVCVTNFLSSILWYLGRVRHQQNSHWHVEWKNPILPRSEPNCWTCALDDSSWACKLRQTSNRFISYS